MTDSDLARLKRQMERNRRPSLATVADALAKMLAIPPHIPVAGCINDPGPGLPCEYRSRCIAAFRDEPLPCGRRNARAQRNRETT